MKIVKRCLWCVVALVGVLAGAVVWWRLWMYHGFPGAPPLLRPFVWTDGESSYDRGFAEMILIELLVVLVGFVTVRYFRKRPARLE